MSLLIKNPNRIMRELRQPFSMDDLEWRVQTIGMSNGRPWARILAYVTNRALQNRLDDVVGCFNWSNEYKELPMEAYDKNGLKINGALSGISIMINGKWVTKWDGADNTAIEPIKGGLSGAMKRAGVQWGVGRYLYDVEAMYADTITEDAFKSLKKEEKELYERAKSKVYNYNTKKKEDVVVYWKPKPLDQKFLPQKYIIPAVVKSIKELCEKTNTSESDILSHYGVEDVRDLFSNEAGQIVELLIQKQKRQEEDENNGK